MGLLDSIFGTKPKQPEPKPQGGLLGNATTVMSERQRYLQHQEEAASRGEQPLPLDQWRKAQKPTK